jgi:modulator of FtsH protease HflC
MKNFAVIFFVLLIAVCLILYLFSFQVRETEVAIVTTWGEPGEPISEPGWKFKKLPSPIQKVHKFDSRPRVYLGVKEETPTRGGDPIVIDSYVVWAIDDAAKFLNKVGTFDKAELLLAQELRNAQNSIVGKYDFSAFVNSDPEKVKLAAIESDMTEALRNVAVTGYGVDVKAVGIRKLGVNEKVTADVFARMKEDRNRRKEAILNEGEAEATKIKDEADKLRERLFVATDSRAKEIKAQGDAEAAKYYKELEKDPEFAKFLRHLEALKIILADNTTIILDQESQPIQLLKGVPDIKPKN